MPPDPPDASTDAVSSRPVRADVTTTDAAGGVLVTISLHNDTAVDVRVRVENDLDAPVLPPRREGIPEVGWDEDGFTGVVPANGRLGIGYACPVADGDAADRTPAEPEPGRESDPISLDVLGPDDEDQPSESDRVATAVRSLGRGGPPADAVPTSPTADGDGHRSRVDRRSSRRRKPAESDLSKAPPSVAAWLDAIEARVRRAERLTDATADEAAAVLEDCGGADGVATLPADLATDLASLRAVGDRIEALTARATETDPDPVVSSLVAAADGGTSATGELRGDSGSNSRRANEAGDTDAGRKR